MGIITILYVVSIAYRVAYLFVRSSSGSDVRGRERRRGPGRARHELPTYTVLIPAYREAAVINHLSNGFAHWSTRDRLDVRC